MPKRDKKRINGQSYLTHFLTPQKKLGKSEPETPNFFEGVHNKSKGLASGFEPRQLEGFQSEITKEIQSLFNNRHFQPSKIYANTWMKEENHNSNKKRKYWYFEDDLFW